MDKKRLFFGLEANCAWPQLPPSGRKIPEQARHATLAFLGNVDFDQLKEKLSAFPKPPFQLTPTGILDDIVFLSNCICYRATVDLKSYPKTIHDWLQIKQEREEYLCHITLARKPFVKEEWNSLPKGLTCIFKAIHLYESIGELNYEPIWSYPLIAAFEEMDHTADLAYRVRGSTIKELHQNAQLALSYHFHELNPFFESTHGHTLEDIIQELNRAISKADIVLGSPYKAVSYHGKIIKLESGLLQWEMIIDV